MLPALYVDAEEATPPARNRPAARRRPELTSPTPYGPAFAMLQAIDAAAQRLQPPLSEEFSRLVADVRLGREPARTRSTAMGRRVGSYDLDMVITAILIQRSSGGNLSEVLDNVAETIRERDRIRGEIRVLTSQHAFRRPGCSRSGRWSLGGYSSC